MTAPKVRPSVGLLLAPAVLASTAFLAACSPAAAPVPHGGPVAEVTSVGLAQRSDGLIDVVVQGVVIGIAENGGRCQFTFWAPNGAASRLTATGAGRDGMTFCGPVSELAGQILPFGDYEVELRYDSDAATYRSERLPVELVP